jgi:hypothetical protein
MNERPIRNPWREFDYIELRDPQRSSIVPSTGSAGAYKDSPSIGPDQDGSAPPPNPGNPVDPKNAGNCLDKGGHAPGILHTRLIGIMSIPQSVH